VCIEQRLMRSAGQPQQCGSSQRDAEPEQRFGFPKHAGRQSLRTQEALITAATLVSENSQPARQAEQHGSNGPDKQRPFRQRDAEREAQKAAKNDRSSSLPRAQPEKREPTTRNEGYPPPPHQGQRGWSRASCGSIEPCRGVVP